MQKYLISTPAPPPAKKPPPPPGLAYDAMCSVVTMAFVEQKLRAPHSTTEPNGEWPDRMRTIANLSAVDRSLRTLVQTEWEATRARLCSKRANGEFVVEDPESNQEDRDPPDSRTSGARARDGERHGFWGCRYLPFSTMAEAYSALARRCIFCNRTDEGVQSHGVHLLRLAPGGDSPFSFLLPGMPMSHSPSTQGEECGAHLGFYGCVSCGCCAISRLNRTWTNIPASSDAGKLRRVIGESDLWERGGRPIDLLAQYHFLKRVPPESPMLRRAALLWNPLVGERFMKERRLEIEQDLTKRAAQEDAVARARLSPEAIRELTDMCPSILGKWVRDRVTRQWDKDPRWVHSLVCKIGEGLRTIHLWRAAGVPLTNDRQEFLLGVRVTEHLSAEVLQLAEAGTGPRKLPSTDRMKAILAHKPGASLEPAFLHVLWSHRRNGPVVELELNWTLTRGRTRTMSMHFVVEACDETAAAFAALKRGCKREKKTDGSLREVRENAAAGLFERLSRSDWAWQNLFVGDSKHGITVADATVGDMLKASRFVMPLALILQCYEFSDRKDLVRLHNVDAHEVKLVRSWRLAA